MRNVLGAIVAVAIAALFVAVVILSPSVPSATLGTLPLGTGSFRPALDGTYVGPCRSGTLPIHWAAFVYQSDKPNTTFRLSGAWTASAPTSVEFGFSVNLSLPHDLENWIILAHCPLTSPNSTPPAPPPLPTSGSVNYSVTTLPGATLFLLVVRTFDSRDVVEVTEPFTATPE